MMKSIFFTKANKRDTWLRLGISLIFLALVMQVAFTYLCSMSINTLSPDEKIQRYNEFNNIDNSASYLKYEPNAASEITGGTDKPATVDFVSTLPPMPLFTPTRGTDLTKATKVDTVDTKPAPNPYALALQPFVKPGGVKVPYKGHGLNQNTVDAYNYYVQEKKLPKHVAAGIVGNLYQESGLKTSAVEQGNTKAGRGIAQWDKDIRWPALQKWAKDNNKNPMDLKTQLDYVLIEPGWADTALKKTMTAKNSDEAAMIFGRTFERPKESLANWKVRKNIASTLLAAL